MVEKASHRFLYRTVVAVRYCGGSSGRFDAVVIEAYEYLFETGNGKRKVLLCYGMVPVFVRKNGSQNVGARCATQKIPPAQIVTYVEVVNWHLSNGLKLQLRVC